MSKKMMALGAILVAILMTTTQFMTWPGYLNYIWTILALIWGIMTFKS